jgi:hypothetical protein
LDFDCNGNNEREEDEGGCTSCVGNKRFNPKYRIGKATAEAIAARSRALFL